MEINVDELASRLEALWNMGKKDEAAAMFCLAIRIYGNDFATTRQYVNLCTGPIGIHTLTTHIWAEIFYAPAPAQPVHTGIIRLVRDLFAK